MKNILPLIYRHLQKFAKGIHRNATKTLFALVSSYYYKKAPFIAEIARGMRLKYKFKNVANRIYRFLNKSEFATSRVYSNICYEFICNFTHQFPNKLILVAMDWTNYGNFWALQLAIPFKGRAIPIYGADIALDKMKNAMTDMEIEAIRALFESIPEQIRKRVVILADRGFSKPELFKLIQSYGAFFIIRLKRDEMVQKNQDFVQIQTLAPAAGQKNIFKEILFTKEHRIKLNLAIYKLSHGEANEDDDDTWFLATNLYNAEGAFDLYPNRMQIEEMFRDFKSSGLHLDKNVLKQEDAFDKLLLVAILTYLFILSQGIDNISPDIIAQVSCKKKGENEISIFRQCCNVLERLFDFQWGSDLFRLFARFWVLTEAALC